MSINLHLFKIIQVWSRNCACSSLVLVRLGWSLCHTFLTTSCFGLFEHVLATFAAIAAQYAERVDTCFCMFLPSLHDVCIFLSDFVVCWCCSGWKRSEQISLCWQSGGWTIRHSFHMLWPATHATNSFFLVFRFLLLLESFRCTTSAISCTSIVFNSNTCVGWMGNFCVSLLELCFVKFVKPAPRGKLSSNSDDAGVLLSFVHIGPSAIGLCNQSVQSNHQNLGKSCATYFVWTDFNTKSALQCLTCRTTIPASSLAALCSRWCCFSMCEAYHDTVLIINT